MTAAARTLQRVAWSSFHQVNQFRHLLIVLSARATRPQFVVQTSKSELLIAAAPVANRRGADPAMPCHCPVALAVARPQRDPPTPHQRSRHAARTYQRPQLQPVRFADQQRFVRSAHPHHRPYSSKPISACKVIYGTSHTREAAQGSFCRSERSEEIPEFFTSQTPLRMTTYLA
jgi:hypothetical protein